MLTDSYMLQHKEQQEAGSAAAEHCELPQQQQHSSTAHAAKAIAMQGARFATRTGACRTRLSSSRMA